MALTGSVTVTTIKSVVLEPGASLIHARMRAALAELDEGEFAEGHELDRKTTKRVAKPMIGRRLSQEEAKRLLRLTAGTTALDRRTACKQAAE